MLIIILMENKKIVLFNKDKISIFGVFKLNDQYFNIKILYLSIFSFIILNQKKNVILYNN